MAASELFLAGADDIEINRHYYQTKFLNQIDVQSSVYSELGVYIV